MVCALLKSILYGNWILSRHLYFVLQQNYIFTWNKAITYILLSCCILGCSRCRYTNIFAIIISNVQTILMRTSFWRTNYFYLSCVTLSNSPILEQPKQINCFSRSWTSAKNELMFSFRLLLSRTVLCEATLLIENMVLRIHLYTFCCFSLDEMHISLSDPLGKIKFLAAKLYIKTVKVKLKLNEWISVKQKKQ